MPTLDHSDGVLVLDLGDGQNRFHPDWIRSGNAALDEVEQAGDPRAFVSVATGKVYSNGLDLEWLSANLDQLHDYVTCVQQLFARVLSLPMIRVAALQGHTFAAGAIFSMAHDFRVMRADRGYWCLPEVDIHIPFTRAMAAMLQSRLAPQTAHEAMVTGRRFGGTDAQTLGIVDRAVAEDAVRATALQIARAHVSRAGDTLGTIKARLYAPVLTALRDTTDPLGGPTAEGIGL